METIKSIVAILVFMLAMIIVAIVFLRLMDRLRNSRDKKRIKQQPKQHPGTPEYAARLRTPHFDELEQHFGIKLPASFRRLYEDASLLLRVDFFLVPAHAKKFADTLSINYFLPAEKSSLELWGETFTKLHRGCLPFAVDDCGDIYYLDFNKKDHDYPVCRFCHDGGDVEKIAASIQEFLSGKPMSRQEVNTNFPD